MEYRVIEKTIFARLDPGEEILESLRRICEAQGVVLAEVNALGALREFSVGLFDVEAKQYHPNHFELPVEVTSLWGTVTTQDGAFYPHLHMSVADITGKEYGGHLQRGVVSATLEMVIRVLDGRVERQYSEEIGLNLMRFL